MTDLHWLGVPDLASAIAARRISPVAVPCGFSDELPVSLQLVGRPFDEATILRLGHVYEEATEWHARRPPLS